MPQVKTERAESAKKASIEPTQPVARHSRAALHGRSLDEQDALLRPEAQKAEWPRGLSKGEGAAKRPDREGAAASGKTEAQKASREKSLGKPPPASDEKPGDKGGGKYPPDVQAVLDSWPDGVAMTFFTDYKKHGPDASEEGKKKDRNNAEFKGRATEQSKAIGAVSMVGGKLVMGKTHAIKDKSTIVEKANEVTSYLARVLSPEDLAANRHKLCQLHIYSHGYHTGMSTGGHHKSKGEGNLSSKNIESFVAAIGGSLRSDVNVALMACSTGSDKKGNEGNDGEGSFADKFRDELMKTGHEGANVSGHTTAGHTTGNPQGRYFTGDGQASSFFEAVFPKDFRLAEAERLKMPPGKFYAKLTSWFYQYTKIWRSGKLEGKKHTTKIPKGAEKFDMGYLMMVDPAQAQTIFKAAWAKADGNFRDFSHVPSVDWSTVGRGGGNSAVEARDLGPKDEGKKSDEQRIDL